LYLVRKLFLTIEKFGDEIVLPREDFKINKASPVTVSPVATLKTPILTITNIKISTSKL
jgi:hypothetical protein